MVEDEFGFGNIPVVTFVNVKGMKEVFDMVLCALIIPLPEGAVSRVQSP